MKLNSKLKHSLAIVIWAIFTLSMPNLIAQTKKEQKILDLYSAQQTKKAEKKAKKLLGKQRSNAFANWVMCATYFNRFQHTSNSSRLINCLRYLKYVDTTQAYTANIHLHIKRAILAQLNDSNVSHAAKRTYKKALEKHYQITFAKPKEKAPEKTIKIPDITDSIRLAIITYAHTLIGTPYKYGGTSSKGLDCSGFTQNVYAYVDIPLPHNANAQKELWRIKTPLEDLQPGDLIFFGDPSNPTSKAGHAGMIYENNAGEITVIHCVSGGVKVEGTNSSWDRYWINKVIHTISLRSLLQTSLTAAQ